ncbi:MAG: hypothetical protein Q8N99_06100 [Nanoarchaeota archaeon]|nr:hypothetical protein [Nanoarchaeota archaeon]
MGTKYWKVPKGRLRVSRLLDAIRYRIHQPYLLGYEDQNSTFIDCDMNPHRNVYTIGEITRKDPRCNENIALWYDLDGKQEQGFWWRPTSSKMQQLYHTLELRDFLIMNEVLFDEKPSPKEVIRKLNQKGIIKKLKIDSKTRGDLIKRFAKK